MPYEVQEWADGEAGETPITAARLTHIEDGIEAATTAAEAADTVTAANITDATAVGRNVLKATDAAAARTAIGAGTSSVTVTGSGSASTAARSDHTHTAANVTDLGDAATKSVGTAAGSVAAGDHTHANLVPTTRTVNGKALSANVTLSGADAALTGYAIGATPLEAVAATDTLNAAIGKLEKRIADLENP